MAGKNRLLAKILGNNNGLITPDSDLLAVASTKNIPTAVGTSVYSSIDDLPSTAPAGEKALVTSTNTLYLYNGGWYRIAVINNFNPQWLTEPDSEYTLELSSVDSDLKIVVYATDSDDVPITYTAVVDSDFNVAATVTHDSDKDNIWVVRRRDSELGAGTTGDVTFKASDGTNFVQKVTTFAIAANSSLTAGTLQARNQQRTVNGYSRVSGTGYSSSDTIQYSISGTGSSDADYDFPTSISGATSNAFSSGIFSLRVQPSASTNNAGDYETHTLTVPGQSGTFKIYPFGHRLAYASNNFINWNIYSNSDLSSAHTWSVRAWDSTTREKIYNMFAKVGNQGSAGNRRSFQGLKIYCIIQGDGYTTTGTKSVQGTTVHQTSVVWAGTPDLTWSQGTSGYNHSIAFGDWNANSVTRTASASTVTNLIDNQSNQNIQLWKIEAYSNSGLTSLINTVYANPSSPNYFVV